MTRTEQEYYNIVLPVVEELGYKLYDVLYVKEGADWYLRLFIDSEKGIDLDDCEKVSNAVGEKLDAVDPIENAYVLEVSSCGLERHLRDEVQFKAAIGKNIEVKLFKAFEKRKQFEGVLRDVLDGKIKIDSEDKIYELNINDISSAKILYNWEENENE